MNGGGGFERFDGFRTAMAPPEQITFLKFTKTARVKGVRKATKPPKATMARG
jgi:hypothetical protein